MRLSGTVQRSAGGNPGCFTRLRLVLSGLLGGAIVWAGASSPFIPASFQTRAETSAAPASRIAQGSPTVGRPAPSFKLLDLAGRRRSLEEFRGRVVLLNFWSTWCLPCVGEMADLEELHKVLSRRGFTVLGVNMNRGEEPVVRRFVAENGLTFPILLDPHLLATDRYTVHAVPATFLIDPEGIVRQRIIGPRPWTDRSTLKVIEPYLPAPPRSSP